MAYKLAHGTCLALLLAAAGCSPKPESSTTPGKAASATGSKPTANPGKDGKPVANPPVSTEPAKPAVESPADRVTRLGGKIEREGNAVIRIDFFGTQIGDTDLAVVREFPDLQSLGLSGTKITDAGLEHLMGLKKLHSLGLQFTDITDAGLFALAKMPALQNVDLLRTKASSVGVTELQKALPKLNISK